MTLFRLFLVIIGCTCISAWDYVATPATKSPSLLLRGVVTYPDGQKDTIGEDATLTVQLQDTSIADAPARTIASTSVKATRFPLRFSLKYSAEKLTQGLEYSVSSAIRNTKGELLYINDVRTLVKPTGSERTRFVHLSVIKVKQTVPTQRKTRWPELVGEDGAEAVRIIKKQSGLTNVVIIKEGSAVTLDYRTDRVRVFVDHCGFVKDIPVIG